MTAPLAIETRGLTRRFGSQTAVDQLDLQVPPGCICGFLGPNGAGKTTTIRLLLGLLAPTAGTVLIQGEVSSRNRPDLRRSLGALVESPSLYPHLTGRENLEVVRRLLDGSTARIDEVLRLVQLTGDAGRLVRTYSLGMRQRLGLALALLADPKVLILDEPANGLDPAGVRDLRELLRNLVRQRGATVFLSSHLLAEVELIADRIAVLDRGRLLFQGALDGFESGRGRSVLLRVDRPGDAAEILRQRGWAPTELDGGSLSVRVSTLTDAASVNAALVAAGIAVYHLAEEQRSLETIFLSATAAAQQGPAA